MKPGFHLAGPASVRVLRNRNAGVGTKNYSDVGNSTMVRGDTNQGGDLKNQIKVQYEIAG